MDGWMHGWMDGTFKNRCKIRSNVGFSKANCSFLVVLLLELLFWVFTLNCPPGAFTFDLVGAWL